MMNSPNTNPNQQKKRTTHPDSWLANILVGWKLVLIISVLVIGTLGVFSSAFLGLEELNQQISNMYDLTLVPVTALDRADIALGNIETQLGTLRNPNLTTSAIAAAYNSIDDSENTFSGILERYKESAQNPDFTKTLASQSAMDLQQQEQSAISSTNFYYGNYSTQLNNFRKSAIEKGALDFHFLDTTIAALGATRNYLRQLSDINRKFALVSSKAATNAYRQAIFTMGSTLAVSALIGLVLAFIVARSIITRLGHVTQAAIFLQHGQLEQRATITVGGKDEIAQMAIAFDTMAEQLIQNLAGLELRVADRTSELEKRSLDLSDRTVQLELANIRTQKRAIQFQAISEVTRTIASIRKLGDLLPRIATVVSEQFGFYHVGIFLLDDANRFAILSASNSEDGKRMLARDHRLKVGAQGIVGFVTQTGKPRIALDTGADAIFFENPDLPETRSEMAVPLIYGGKIIGAMDVQSIQSNAFTDEDSNVIQILADQISIAIDNARQFELTQKLLGESETIYRQYVRREWDRMSETENILGYRHTIIGTQAMEQPVTTIQARQVMDNGEILVEDGSMGKDANLFVPIKLRDEVIGFLNIRSPQKRSWKNDEINLVKSVADRVAISAENARLFEETTDRAERERTVSQITSKIRSTNDPNEMIQIALDELKQALHVKDARIMPYAHPQTPEKG